MRTQLITACVLSIVLPPVTAATVRAAEVDFAHDIVPILRAYCAKCHTGDKNKGGFSMNTREAFLAGGESGAVVVPGKSAQSELVDRLTTDQAELRMPPEGLQVAAEKVTLLRAWIDSGVPWTDGFSFEPPSYEPPLKPRRQELPPAVDGRTNPIDRLVDAYLTEHGIERPGPISDAAFLRRVYLDVVGLLPEPEKLDEFLADGRPDKRTRLVRELLADDVAYAEHWLTFFNDLLRNDYTGTGFITGGRKQITAWLYRVLVENVPYDQVVRELIAPSPDSEGFIQGIRWRGNVSASQAPEVQFAQSISQSFLGINMKCASCHDSFIDHWKLADAYGLAAIYAAQPLPIYRCDKPMGEQGTPTWIFPELGRIQPDAPQPERLKQLAALMTHPDNGRFTRTIVNRIWQRLMGRGIVHPVDAMHTQPWSDDLLDYLAVDFADRGHDLKLTIELVCTSQTYQARTPPVNEKPEGGAYVFHGPKARRLSAEQFVDAIWQVTGAAPVKPDAVVFRGRTPPSEPTSAPFGAERLQGQWIWSYAAASGASPAGETITMRRRFQLSAAPIASVAAITCDNEYVLFANGRKVQADDNWETVEAVDLAPALRTGMNELVIVAKNGGGAPNPAGLFFEARIRFPEGGVATIASDTAWEWTAILPNDRGEFKPDPADWKPAAAVENPAVWSGRVGEACLAVLTQSAGGPARMVRASLMKSDVLMRSLGRPNRDQIVTMRPEDLTTLEAIELANGQVLAETLERGAKRLSAKLELPDAFTSRLYRFALSRSPTERELTLAREALGPRPDEQSIQDLLWAVFMLPEFQLLR
ncbi:MAG TPA: DUF1549 domain-containing protein [Pirellulales bacterium]|nr:DUF1549 domain-containing protein [Pirellulales bacterium]